ncbi:hypothetical protein [Undibacter mobilis]|uniref:Uncharacterized protein n=1 Tax=Undibacter mobilis TaxID=2292256 RepID=A0A371B8I7_9BRAD|nr:hypothetical protein [Undibacter mobilis]RDV03880.1 hypothetical protein DXH78_04330 [Undibacter mobilis]
MSAVLVSPLFWLGLALKIVMTASIVVVASVIVERSGPFIGALIAALPTAGGAAMILLAIEHDAHFIAQSTIGSMVANAVCPIFALTFAVLAPRYRLLPSLGGALAVWLAGVFLSRLVPWTVSTALLANAIVYPVAIYIGLRLVGEVKARARVAVSGRDLAWRAGVATLAVVLVTALSSSIGSYFSGVFAFFPVAMSSFFIILYTRAGGAAAASVAAHLQAPLIGLTFSLLAVHLLAEVIGVWWAYLIGLAIGIAWNGLLWLWKNRKR